jgi:hypothetical protein
VRRSLSIAVILPIAQAGRRPVGRRSRGAAGFIALVLLAVLGTPATAVPVAAQASEHHRVWSLGLDDNGGRIHVREGDDIVVRLPGGAAGGFHRARSTDRSRVRRTAARGGYPSDHRAVARFTAVGKGRANLTSMNDYRCLHTTPPCLPPQREWVAHVTVRAGDEPAPIGPGQSYLGLVNGTGSMPSVDVVCAGPAGGDRTGPPASGQTLDVAPSPALSGSGFTGSRANRVVALFADDSSLRVPLDSYQQPQGIPTKLQLPCEGTGVVRFVPRPTSRDARADRLVVQFVNIAD